jgi:recombination associated protein RdgC
MLFKNMIVYRLPVDYADWMMGAVWESGLSQHIAEPCGRTDLQRSGFVSPFDHDPDGLLTRWTDGRALICLQTEQKIIPGSVIRDAIQARVAHIEQRDARKVWKKERDQLKDEVMLDLLPRAFVRKSFLYALVCPRDRLIIVNTTSHAKAEDLLSRLREALGSLPALPFTVNDDASGRMTSWLAGTDDFPEEYSLGRSCQMYNPLQHSSVVRCKDMDLDADEINEHMQAGMMVSRLAIGWRDELTGTITSDLTFRGISFADVLIEEAHGLDLDDKEAVRDSELAMMAGTLVKFLQSVTDTFGGEVVPMRGDGGVVGMRKGETPNILTHGERVLQPGECKGDAHLQTDAFGGAA